VLLRTTVPTTVLGLTLIPPPPQLPAARRRHPPLLPAHLMLLSSVPFLLPIPWFRSYRSGRHFLQTLASSVHPSTLPVAAVVVLCSFPAGVQPCGCRGGGVLSVLPPPPLPLAPRRKLSPPTPGPLVSAAYLRAAGWFPSLFACLLPVWCLHLFFTFSRDAFA
jgi:hypothetical protein